MTPENLNKAAEGGSSRTTCSPTSTPESIHASYEVEVDAGLYEIVVPVETAMKLERERNEAWCRNMVDDHQKLLLIALCERAKSICMGDADDGESDDWITDYNAFLSENNQAISRHE